MLGGECNYGRDTFTELYLGVYNNLTEEEVGDGDTYILGYLMDDGWEIFCDLCHTHKQAVKYMEEYFPEYTLMKYQIAPITFKDRKSVV